MSLKYLWLSTVLSRVVSRHGMPCPRMRLTSEGLKLLLLGGGGVLFFKLFFEDNTSTVEDVYLHYVSAAAGLILVLLWAKLKACKTAKNLYPDDVSEIKYIRSNLFFIFVNAVYIGMFVVFVAEKSGFIYSLPFDDKLLEFLAVALPAGYLWFFPFMYVLQGISMMLFSVSNCAYSNLAEIAQAGNNHQ